MPLRDSLLGSIPLAPWREKLSACRVVGDLHQSLGTDTIRTNLRMSRHHFLAYLLWLAALAFATAVAVAQPAVLVKDINPLGPSSPEDLTVVGDRILFTAMDDAARGRELWITDGTEVGTILLRDVNPGPFRDSLIRDLTPFRGGLYFGVGSPFHLGPGGLWMSDGTDAGTGPVPSSPLSAGGLTVAGSRLFFFSGDALGGADLCWVDHDAQVGCAGLGGLRLFGPSRVAVATGGRLFFAAALGRESVDIELWTSDGSAGGTRLVRDIRPGAAASAPRSLTSIAAELYFTASDDGRVEALWRSDGSEAGTHLVMSFESEPSDLLAAADRLFFVAGTTPNERSLWVSDGSKAGPRLLRRSQTGGIVLFPVAPLGRSALLVAGRADNTSELWISDGTPDGTRQLRSFANPRGVLPYGFTDIGGRIVFTACAAQGCEPWITEGTREGTQQLADVWAGVASSYPSNFALLGSHLLFNAESESGAELWSIEVGHVCAGDCNGDGQTTIAELTVGVAIALGTRAVADCRALDVDTTGHVSVAELVGAVQAVLAGCVGAE